MTTRFQIPILLFGLLLWANLLPAQSRDIRARVEHHVQTGEPKFKYEYYHNQWSERDVQHGRSSKWAPNGQLLEDGFYWEGEKDSLYQRWYMNGQAREVSAWKRGLRHGKTRLYDRSGRLLSETDYKDDLRDGIETIYHSNGQVGSVTQYRQGEMHGFRTEFNKRGKKKKARKYAEGVRVRKRRQVERGEKREGVGKNQAAEKKKGDQGQ